jgi:hypothetical protein
LLHGREGGESMISDEGPGRGRAVLRSLVPDKTRYQFVYYPALAATVLASGALLLYLRTQGIRSDAAAFVLGILAWVVIILLRIRFRVRG